MAIYNPPVLIAPSILSADFAELGNEVDSAVRAGADWIHFDAMDNHFVPNLTIGPGVLKSLRKRTTAPIDAHLMVEPTDAMATLFAKAGADYVTVHAEATKHLDRTLSVIRDAGAKAGLAFNPATPIDALKYVIDKVDLVLIMSVNPGFGGQSFIPSSLSKIALIRDIIEEHFYATRHEILLEVDGGINPQNVGSVIEAGANVIVAGSAVFGKRDATGYLTVISTFKDAIRKATYARNRREEEANRTSGSN